MILQASPTALAGQKQQVALLTTGQRYYMIGIFTMTAALLYADQNLMAPLLTPIAREFGFDDEKRDRLGPFG